MPASFDPSDVRFVTRITVGGPAPQSPETEAKAAEAMALLNRCLSSTPPGRIIGTEKVVVPVGTGEGQVLAHWVTYHVGFLRKPLWLEA